MMSYLSRVVLVVMTIVAGITWADFTCVPPPTRDWVSPARPTILESMNDYQARIEVNVLDKNYSMVVDEYLDYTGNRGALVTYRQGVKLMLLYSYVTGEVFHINLADKSCITKNITDDYTSFIFGPLNFGNPGDPQKHIFSSAQALRFAANANDIYLGTKNVRGIPADVWTTCLPWSSVSGQVNATFYFSVPSWNVSGPIQQVPLRIEIEGDSDVAQYGVTPGTTLAPGSKRHFHHIYDFINYLPYIAADPSIFQTPPEVVCTKREETGNLPQFSSVFRYRAEIVDPTSSLITHYAVWYNEEAKLVREDKRPVNPDSTINTKDAVTELHDFKTGIRYVIDQLGGCQIHPLDLVASDTQENMDLYNYNKSIIVDIRDPMRFFSFNDDYKFVGQRTARGIICDVFSNIVPDFPALGGKVNATMEYYFMASNWNDLPLDGMDTDARAYPVQLVISAPSVYYTRIYNFFDYAQVYPLNLAFDASPCFEENQRLRFKLTFPGNSAPGQTEQWKEAVYHALAIHMKVNPIRVTGLSVEVSDFNTYVSAMLLGTSNAAMFEKIQWPSIERTDSKVYKGITMPDECANLCINNTDFICNGYQYCPSDGYACRLLRDRVPSTPVLENATACDAFTRTVDFKATQEPIIKDAYANLVDAINAGLFQVEVMNPSTNSPDMFKAIDVDIISGQPMKTKPLPTMPQQFSYRVENVVPAITRVVETFVWYDSLLDIVRFDSRDPDQDNPYMATYIHDFTTGVAYEINDVTKKCKISPISQGAFDVVTGKPSTDGSLVVSMKSPQSMFYLDNSYRYVGQKTVRGIVCDVFESKREDFRADAYNITDTSIFKYYFQSDDWDYVAPDSTDITKSKPVMLEIEDVTTNLYMAFNFYDFNDQHYTLSHFDTSSCYEPSQRHTFMIIFKDQSYHPTLDQASSSFLNTALVMLGELTMTSPIRFQRASVDYDDSSVYLTVTALGKVPPFDLFRPVMKVGHNTSASSFYADNPQDCAAACASSPTPCNSYDWCDDIITTACLLGQRHKESEGNPLNSNTDKPCVHYSRSENVSYPSVDVASMYLMITDNVYDNLFQVRIDLPQNMSKTYTATDIRDDLLRSTDPDSAAGSVLKKFAITPNARFVNSFVNTTHTMVSLTDCAIMCLQENTFTCESFDYQFTTGLCRESSNHPDMVSNPQTVLNRSQDTSVYSILYTHDYTKFDATVFIASADKVLQNVNGDEMCARACTTNQDFACESFETCTDGNCFLRKLHRYDAGAVGMQQSSNCQHYSRNYLFDYIPRQFKTLQVPAESVANVQSVDECAQLCSTGVGLPLCAAFTVCQGQRGDTQCSFTTVDPTKNPGVIQSSDVCSLYTRANPMPMVNPSTSRVLSIENTSYTYLNITSTTSTQTPSTTASTTKQSTTTSTTKSAVTSTVPSVPCSAQSNGSPDDTGPRVGIAFGTLVLGIIVGAVGVFMFLRYRFRKADNEDAQMLKTWNN